MESRWFLYGAALLLTAVSAGIDWRTGKIPDWLTLPPLVIAPLVWGFAVPPMYGGGVWGGVWSLIGAVVCALIPLFLFLRNAPSAETGDTPEEAHEEGELTQEEEPRPLFGGGDVKLFAALGAICQVAMGVELQMFSVMAAALASMGLLAFHGKLLRTLLNSFWLGLNPLLPKRYKRAIDPESLSTVRLGPWIFVGTLVNVMLREELFLKAMVGAG